MSPTGGLWRRRVLCLLAAVGLATLACAEKVSTDASCAEGEGGSPRMPRIAFLILVHNRSAVYLSIYLSGGRAVVTPSTILCSISHLCCLLALSVFSFFSCRLLRSDTLGGASRLVDALYDPDHTFFVHFDRKMHEAEVSE